MKNEANSPEIFILELIAMCSKRAYFCCERTELSLYTCDINRAAADFSINRKHFYQDLWGVVGGLLTYLLCSNPVFLFVLIMFKTFPFIPFKTVKICDINVAWWMT